MFSSCLHRVPHRRSSSNQHKARSPLHKIDRDAAAARQVPGRRCATRYHTISLPSPASSYERYYFSSETGRRRARPNALTRPRGSQRPVRTASPGSSPRRSPLLFRFRRAGAGRWGPLVFAPCSGVCVGCEVVCFMAGVLCEFLGVPRSFFSALPSKWCPGYCVHWSNQPVSQSARVHKPFAKGRASVL